MKQKGRILCPKGAHGPILKCKKFFFANNIVMQGDKLACNEDVVTFSWGVVLEGFIQKLILKKHFKCRCSQLGVEIGKER